MKQASELKARKFPKPENAALAPYLRLTWWTVYDAANILTGNIPPPPNRKDFNTNLDTGGDAALLYFELKNAVSFDAQEDSQLVGPNARIRPALATRIALWRGITPPPDLVPLAAESTEATRELSQRREDTLLRTIGALLALCTGKLHKEAIFTAQDDLAEYLDSKTGLRGLGKRNLQKIFAEANTEYDVSANK